MKGFPVRPVPVESVGEAAKAVARRQAEQLTLVRRRAQPTAVYIARLTVTAVFAYLLALQLPGGSSRSVLAPLTALLVVQATLFHTIGTAIRRVAAVTAGVLAAVAVAAYVPFSWWVLGLLIAGTLVLGIVLRLRDEILEVPISAMLIFSVDSHAAATSRITETLIGAAAGLAAGLVFAPLRVQPAKNAVGDLSRQMADLLAQMADGLAEVPDPRRAAEWLDRTRALRGEIERVDDALAQAEESVRLNPRRLRFGDPAAGLREGVDTLERAATDMRVLARSVADSARIDSDHSPVREAETRARLAAVIAELSAAVRAYGQLLEADPVSADFSAAEAAAAAEPIAEALEDHLEEAQRQQDQLADLLSTDPAERPEGWQLRGEILAHVDRLRSELEPGRLPDPAPAKPPLRALRDRARSDIHWSDRHHDERHRQERHHDERHRDERHHERHREPTTGPRRQPNRAALRARARRTVSRVSRVSGVSGVRARRAR
ncbi:MAG: FUSC family protein, partial [Streptosporangiaceae bacterium]